MRAPRVDQHRSFARRAFSPDFRRRTHDLVFWSWLKCAARQSSSQYNQRMQEKMQWNPENPFEYNFDRGLYYHHMLSDWLLCGSQPTNAEDVQYLREAEGVKAVLSVRTTPTAMLDKQLVLCAVW